MKLDISSIDPEIKKQLEAEIGITLGDPAWSAYNEDGTPAKGAIPVYDDPRLTIEHEELVRAVVDEPTKATERKSGESLKELYITEGLPK